MSAARRPSGAGHDRPRHRGLARVADDIVACRACPRLTAYLDASRARFPDHWCRPVPGFGDPGARLLVVGLAPGLHGANKTGRVFTFDSSGEWLYRALHEVGLASAAISRGPRDGLVLSDVFITGAARCAPPQNKPTPDEVARCRPFLEAELGHLGRVRVAVALGRIAHDQLLRARGLRPAAFAFAHGAEHALPGLHLIDSYHCSRQNTNTGRLTRAMFARIFARAAQLARGDAAAVP